MIAIIDTGGANLSSVSNALDRLEYQWIITKDQEKIEKASHVILPGVGAAADSMERIRSAGLDSFIPTLTQPTLGICLGMQLLFAGSSEGHSSCLNILSGNVSHIPEDAGLPLPHMGWNRLQEKNGGSQLLKGLKPEDSWVYFVHSYRAPDTTAVKAIANYGCEIPAIVEADNFFGTQFHPEKSASCGAQILRNFLSL